MIPKQGKNVFKLKKLPTDWKACLLSEAVDIKGGSQPPKKVFKTEMQEGYVRLVQIRDYKSDRFLTYVPVNSTKKFCTTEDIMIGRYGPPVFQILRGIEGAYNVALMKANPLNNMDRDYLYYLLSSSPVQKLVIENSQRTAGQTGVNLKLLNSCIIPLPPLNQQKKIAAILDAADSYKQKTKTLIDKYDELTQSLFLDMFGDPVTNPKGWDEIKLGNVCNVGSSKRVFVSELVEEGIPFYRGTEVGKLGEGKSINPTLFITKAHYESLKEHRGVPKQGDLLMPSICPDGRIWVVDNDKEFYFKDGRVLWVEVDLKKMNSIYLRYHLKGSFFANYNNIASGTTFAELKIVSLKKMNVFYPNMKLQNQFAERVKAIEVQKAQAHTSLAQADNLFNSLLQKAFKGELI